MQARGRILCHSVTLQLPAVSGLGGRSPRVGDASQQPLLR